MGGPGVVSPQGTINSVNCSLVDGLFSRYLSGNMPWDNAYLDSHLNDSAFQRTAAGYLDQRAYIDRAIAALDGLAVQKTILAELSASSPSPLSTDGLDDWPLDAMGAPIGDVQCGAVQLGFNNAGAIDNLLDSRGRQWAGVNNRIGRFRYSSHSEWEFDSYGERYMLPGCRNDSSANLCGFGKAGLSSKAGALVKIGARQSQDRLGVTLLGLNACLS